jgi:hypothetical protein
MAELEFGAAGARDLALGRVHDRDLAFGGPVALLSRHRRLLVVTLPKDCHTET